ncbi:MAG: hypothetical protein M3P51_02635 [Chloroflexota bacterium]|nr:hypothetical protein [Chloroflexota bacterium]
MFRVGSIIRALPAIVVELGSLVWYAYRTGDRAMAGAALVWLTCTVGLAAMLVSGTLTVLRGGEVHVRGPLLIASTPIAMWLARELIGILMTAVGWLLSLIGHDPLDARS